MGFTLDVRAIDKKLMQEILNHLSDAVEDAGVPPEKLLKIMTAGGLNDNTRMLAAGFIVGVGPLLDMKGMPAVLCDENVNRHLLYTMSNMIRSLTGKTCMSLPK